MSDGLPGLSVLAFLHRPTLQLAFAVSMQGAALMVAAALFFTARRQLTPALGGAAPWGWLGAFAAFRTAAVVVPVMASQVTPGLALDGFRAAYFFAAALGWWCVMEFGLRLAGDRARWGWIRWWPAGGAIIAAACGGWAAWAWWLGWGVALPASVVTACAFWRTPGLFSPMVRGVLGAGLLALAALEMTGLSSVDLYQGYSVYRISEVQMRMGFLPLAWAEWRPPMEVVDSVRLSDRLLALWGALAAVSWAGAWWWACYRDVAARGKPSGDARRLLWGLPLAMLVLVGGGFEVMRRTIRATTVAHAERRFEQMEALAAAVDAHMVSADTPDEFASWVRDRGLARGFGRVFVWADIDGRRTARWVGGDEAGFPARPPDRELTNFERAMETRRMPYMLRPHREAGELVATWNHPLANTLDGRAWWLGVRQDGVAYFHTMVLPRAYSVVLVFMLGLMGLLFYLFYIRREAELALRIGRERAEASDRAKTELVARVSHELRTPLQGLLGYAELLARARLDPESASRLEAMRGQGTLLLRLVNDLLDYGALQIGRLSLQREVFRLSDVTEAAWATVRPGAEKKRLRCATRMDEREVWFRGDALRVRQVLNNLLGNAVKFTPADGAVELEVAVGEGRVRFTVADTGPGISEVDTVRVFEPMERGRMAGESVEGAGLGLPLARSLCQAMGGTLRLEQRPGYGAVFTAELVLSPAERPAPNEGATTDVTTPSGVLPSRVLVADDNALLRQLLEIQLTELGGVVRVVSDGDEALEAWSEERHDAVILDLSMERVGGAEAARRIRALSGDARRPWIVGLSAHALAEDKEACLRAGMNRFITKPADLATLAEALAAGGEGAPRRERAGNSLVSLENLGKAHRAVLWAAFREETPKVLERMAEAVACADWPEVRRRAHYLRSTALVIGNPELAEACGRCEDAARDGCAADIAREANLVAAAALRLAGADADGAA